MALRIALAGNPNSGKTTLFNALTGSNQFVGNWPGVTVEKKEGHLRGNQNVVIVDLPGIYSLSSTSLEEIIARDYLLEEKPDAILNIVDGTNLERNLYLTTQLAELGLPMIVAVNMLDIMTNRGDRLDDQKLSSALGCPVMEISALKGNGVKQVAQIAEKLVGEHGLSPSAHTFSEEVEEALEAIQTRVLKSIPSDKKRWYALKLFERDEAIAEKLDLSAAQIEDIDAVIEKCEGALDDDSESIITFERYQNVSEIIKISLSTKSKESLSTSDKIDRVVTNRWLALPIFALVMFLVYYISVTSVGTIVTDWTNEVLFGEIVAPAVEGFLSSVGTAAWMKSLILDGIIGGVGAVLGFVPQMLVLFLFLAILEDSGYMARIAFIMDRIFRRFGLSGKSFIPMLIGTGCSVPGIMASRTIENENDRRMTVMTTSFIPCTAKLPIIALIAGSLFGGAWWVGPSAYFAGIVAVITSGIILKKTKRFNGEASPFVMELPAYHVPSPSNVIRSTTDRGRSFIKKAGTIILLSTIVIWFTSNFGMVDGNIQMVEDLSNGFLAVFGSAIAWIFTPLGWGDWKAAVATITGLVAKENIISTFSILYGFAEVTENGAEIWGTVAANFTTLSAYSFLLFNLLCTPCFAAVGAIKHEMNNSGWTWFALIYQTVFAYVVSLCFYQIGSWVTGQPFTIWTVIALLLATGFMYLLFRKPKDVKTARKSVFAATADGGRA
ncbi:MAG: ferrous iron transport protein B [Anaerolineaceae bacterium]